MRPSTAIHALLTAIVVGVTTCGAGLRADEFVCEEAHARLVECCPGFSVDGAYCTYDDGCGEGTRYPRLSEPESQCIRTASCATLRERGICARAAAAPAVAEPNAGSSGGTPPSGMVRPYERPSVCP